MVGDTAKVAGAGVCAEGFLAGGVWRQEERDADNAHLRRADG